MPGDLPAAAAAHVVLRDLFTDDPWVRVKNPTLVDPPFTGSLEALLAAASPAYVVEVVPNFDSFAVVWTGRFGLDQDLVHTNYPVPHTDPQFVEKLTELVAVLVTDFKQRAHEQQQTDLVQAVPTARAKRGRPESGALTGVS